MQEHDERIKKELKMPGQSGEDAFQEQNRQSMEAQEMHRQETETLQKLQKQPAGGQEAAGELQQKEERLSLLNDMREEVKSRLPASYGELLESKRKIFGDSKEMDLVKKTLRLAGDAVLKENTGAAYTEADLKEVIKLYNDAIDACNFYVNSTRKDRTNRRYALVKMNLERMDGELKKLDELRRSIKSGKSDGKAANILELINKPFEKEVVKKTKVEVRDEILQAGQQYTFSLQHRFEFDENFSFGKAAEQTIRRRKEILGKIPGDLSPYDEDVRKEYELIKKWAGNEPLTGKWLKDIKRMKADEESSAKEIYRNLDKLKASKEENIRKIALQLETMMKGNLQVNLNDKNTVDLSTDEDEARFRIKYRGEDWKKNVEIDKTTDRTDEPLFEHEPCVADLHQGGVGDCYFITSLAVLVERDPAFIKNSIADLGDRVAVRFANFGKPKTVIVKKSTVSGGGRELGAEDSPLWVRMMEKAFSLVLAGWVDGCDGNQGLQERCQRKRLEMDRMDYTLIRSGNPYEALDAGGHTPEFIEFFTGKKISSSHSLTGFHRAAVSLDSLAEKARSGMKAEEIPAASEYYDRKIRQWVSREFTRTKVKTYSEYLEALEEVEKVLEDENTKLEDHPGQGLSEEERKKAFKKYIKDLKKQVKTDSRIVQVDHSLVGEGAYSKEEIKLFNKFEKADKEKKLVTVRTRHAHKFARRNADADEGRESESGGFYSGHAYTFMGVRRLNENGRERLFVLLRNPWGNKVRRYDKDARARLQKNTREKDEEYRKKTLESGKEVEVRLEHADTNGVFHMELRDFLNMGEYYSIEK